MAISGGDGSIILDTKVDTKGLNSGLNSMKGAITKIGGLLAAAFSVKMLTNFVKEIRNLYKIQMENEVKLATVMRQRMKATDDEIKSMLELASAQQQIGIIGNEVQLAGLQQIATFATQKETIETLLPAMNNLIAQQYGYEASTESARNVANLMGKVLQGQVGALTRVGITFSAAEEQMLKTGNEMERAAVLAQVITNNVGEMNTALAQTDVGRQQQLANTWGDIKEQFGAAFQQIAIIALPALNAVAKALAWVANVARMVAQTIANMFGMKTSGGGGNQSTGLGGISTSSDKAAKGMSNLGNATEKAGKQAKKSTAAFDDLQILTESAASSAGKAAEGIGEMGDVGSSIGGDVGTGFDFGIQEDIDTTPLETALGRIKGLLEPIQEMFMSGFWQGFQNADFTPIDNAIKGIGDNLKKIFTSPEIKNSAQNFANSFTYSLGQMAGSIGSIAITTGTNFYGGLNQYLTENLPFIQQSIAKIFDAGAYISETVGNLWAAFANIFSVFASQNGITLTSNIVGIFANAGLGITTLATQICTDFMNFLAQPIIDNQEGLKVVLEGLLGNFSSLTGSIKELVDGLVEDILLLYDENVQPFIETLTETVSTWVGNFVDAYNKHIKPVIDEFAQQFQNLVEEHLVPMFDIVIECVGKVIDIWNWLWDNVLKPIGSWLIDNFLNVFGNVFYQIKDIVFIAIGEISDSINNIFTIFNGIIDFIVGVFTGDWERAWEGIKGIFTGIINGIITGIETGVNLIITAINGLIGGIDIIVGAAGSALGLDWNIPKIPKLNLPRLAQGAVIPPNREFLAVLGDQKRGTNIEAPAELIKQMAKEAIQEMGITQNANQVIKEEHYYLNQTELMNIIYKLAKGGERIKGSNLVQQGGI